MPRKLNSITNYFNKLYAWPWTLGVFNGDIKKIIKEKSFDPEIQWLPVKLNHRFFADPFFLKEKNGNLTFLVEEFFIKKNYGKISLLKLIQPDKTVYSKVLLDTKSHLSYPYIYRENDRIYVFPEAGRSGVLSCYEYHPEYETLSFVKVIMNLPIVDPTILKYNDIYWLFGTLSGKDSFNKLYLYFSDDLFGPYKEHPQNPIKDTLIGSRPAGNIIEVDGTLYRPSQNCIHRYGESITINRVNTLDESSYSEDAYMQIAINKNRRSNKGMQTIHTINVEGNMIVVDGQRKKFAPFFKLKYFIKRLV